MLGADSSASCTSARAKAAGTGWRGRVGAAVGAQASAEPGDAIAAVLAVAHGAGQQRGADHLCAVVPAWHAERGQQHVRALALPTVAAARAHQPPAVAHPHLPLTREPPRPQRSRAVRALNVAGRERGLQPVLADSRYHQTTLLHARTRASRTPTEAGGAARVALDITPQNAVQPRSRTDVEPQ